MQPYTPEQVQSALESLHKDWTNVDNALLQLHIEFTDFDEAISFVNHVAKIANAADHHPDMYIHYNKVTIELSTHDVNGITAKDISLAKQIEAML